MKWTKCSNLPVPMTAAHSTVINGILYIGGGWCKIGNDEYLMFSYKLIDDQWMRLPLLPQCNGVPVNINDGLSYIGGHHYSTSCTTNKVITLHNNHWVTQYPNMTLPRKHHAVVSYHHYTIVAGGEGEDMSKLDTIEVFNCNSNQWIILSTHLPQPMMCINAGISNQSFIIAGYTSANDYGNNHTYIISMDSLVESNQNSLTSSTSEDDNQWSQLCSVPCWSTAIVPNTSPPVIIGGYDNQGKVVNNISLYDDSSNSWRTVSSLPISCAQATVATINDVIIVAGGYNDGNRLNSVVLGQLELSD